MTTPQPLVFSKRAFIAVLCSCGASFFDNGQDADANYAEWSKTHPCEAVFRKPEDAMIEEPAK